ncbi:hypothetical protein V2G26_011164 [Clonostachys chloroleuca]
MAEGPTYRISVDSLKLAEMLISAGADYLITDKHGNSILHLLAAGLKIEDERGFFEQMVQRGMDIPLDMAAAYGNLEVLKIFEKNT